MVQCGRDEFLLAQRVAEIVGVETMYRIHITANPPEIGAGRSYQVAVFLPGQSSATTAMIQEHNLEVILNEIVTNLRNVREYLNKAQSKDGALIELPVLSEQHFNMLRGLPPHAVGR
jgi:hypothetical protein